VLLQGDIAMFRTSVRFKHKARDRRHSRHSGKGVQRSDWSAQAFPLLLSIHQWARLPASVDGVAPLGKGDGHSLRGAPCHERGQPR
jgi:hypothetical protein